MKDAQEEIIVAGGNGKGDSLSQSHKPQGVIVDRLGPIYISDTYNHRVMRWCTGATEGTIAVGGKKRGRLPYQLMDPRGLSFDQELNLYVVDCQCNRIQKFQIINNE